MKIIFSRIVLGSTIPLLALLSFGGVAHADYPNPGNGQLSVQGVDAPQQLSVGQSGMWTVRVFGLNGYQSGGQLHYSVVWGDENNGTYAASSYGNTSVQSSGTFTHVYVRSGTYRVLFTVTDDYGHNTQSSVTTQVNGSSPNGGNNGTYNNGNCTSYYDRNCYGSNGQFLTNTPVNTVNCGRFSMDPACVGVTNQYSYTSSNSTYSCYYDRNCYANTYATQSTNHYCGRFSMDPACVGSSYQYTYYNRGY